jgi:hypothetical protein
VTQRFEEIFLAACERVRQKLAAKRHADLPLPEQPGA